MAGKDKRDEPMEDRDFLYRLRNEQRDMVMGELKKEQLGVATRIKEEEKKFEEAQAGLQAAKSRIRLKKILAIAAMIIIIFLLYYLYRQGYFGKALSYIPPANLTG